MTESIPDATETLGERLTLAMRRKGVKNPEVATAADVVPNTVSKWRNDVQPPNDPQLRRVADFLGVSAAWLRYGEAGIEREAQQRGDPVGRRDFVSGGRGPIYVRESLPRPLAILAKEFEIVALNMGANPDDMEHIRNVLQSAETLIRGSEGYGEPLTLEQQRVEWEGNIAMLREWLRKRISRRKAEERRK